MEPLRPKITTGNLAGIAVPFGADDAIAGEGLPEFRTAAGAPP